MKESLSVFLTWLWAALFFACVVVAAFPGLGLDFVAKHGKQMSTAVQSSSPTFPAIFSELVVSKSWFAHMYMMSLLWCSIFLSLEVIGGSDHNNYYALLEGRPSCRLVVIVIFAMHSMRRYLESIYTFRYGQAKMHVLGYLVGLVYYILVPWTLFNESDEMAFEFKGVRNMIGLTLFFGGNFMQNRFHRYLGSSKEESVGLDLDLRRSARQKKYKYPTGFGFDHVYCPHYTAEVIIYVGLNLLLHSSLAMKCIQLFVMANLSITANKNYVWYHDNFPAQTRMKGYSHRRRIFPYIY